MDFIKETIKLAKKNVAKGGKPFACLIVRNGKVIASGVNRSISTNDPTAHDVITAIRKATKLLKKEQLTDCEFYLLAEPCPMCLGALYFCSPKKVTFVVARDEYGAHYRDKGKYFTLETLYKEFSKPWNKRKLPMVNKKHREGIAVYTAWKKRRKER